MLLDRDDFVTALFRETDRAQRMKTQLSLVYFGIAEAESRSSQLHPSTFEVAIEEIVERIAQTLRSYDSVTRMGVGEFAMLLPGCTSSNAMSLARRLNQRELATPIVIEGTETRLASYFGITTSRGRSALVVLREAEQAFRSAKAQGAGSIVRSTGETDADLACRLVPMLRNEPSRQ